MCLYTQVYVIDTGGPSIPITKMLQTNSVRLHSVYNATMISGVDLFLLQ